VVPGLSSRAAISVAKFVALLDRLGVASDRPVREILEVVLSETGYRDEFAYSEDEEDQQRVANIDELLAAADEFDRQHPYDGGLERYLEQAALVSDTDAWEGATDRVTLMTLHSAKGLEFPVVFIIAVEQGQIPHERSKEDEEQLEEERRLLFVGITRAKEELHLSRALYRYRRGRPWPTVPSSFLSELPTAELEKVKPPRTSGEAMPPSPDSVWQDGDFAQDAPTAATGGDDYGEASHARGGARQATVVVQRGIERPSPDAFQQGMLVEHPNYGTGEIVALGGTDARRTATVRFHSSEQSMTFCIAFSPLRPK
jgi:DNA helicase-2/ATP-dependent DNA helicase PcrA